MFWVVSLRHSRRQAPAQCEQGSGRLRAARAVQCFECEIDDEQRKKLEKLLNRHQRR